MGGKLLLSTRPSSLLKNSTFSIKRERSGEGGKRGGERERGRLSPGRWGKRAEAAAATPLPPFPFPFSLCQCDAAIEFLKRGEGERRRGRAAAAHTRTLLYRIQHVKRFLKIEGEEEEELLSPSPFFET